MNCSWCGSRGYAAHMVTVDGLPVHSGCALDAKAGFPTCRAIGVDPSRIGRNGRANVVSGLHTSGNALDVKSKGRCGQCAFRVHDAGMMCTRTRSPVTAGLRGCGAWVDHRTEGAK